ncbi:polymer-forming cytoskeletal protein [Myxococcota bacterium]|nr:polymer-forming cytoskeletal protein [Myxococcota bacterium]
MSLTSFGRERSDSNPSSDKIESDVNPRGLTAFIDQGSVFEGKLSFKDTVRIDGRFQGEIASENTLIVGETGEIEASIRSKSILISGTVTGDLFATNRVVLNKTAKVEGNIETTSIVVEDGAEVNGMLSMKPALVKSEKSTLPSANLKPVEGGRETEQPKSK